ncbi:hypothetical protein [Breznakiella homolactica]|uniref:Uncharacterized protein n=1 Tax=Breznakiella homolactica TaxID=2798577 RepID=A0A7T7XNS9_9SPIR|nr:hypothetical protein [Breznakiella homolactica]QQO09731.1 hypothetical protein JFL75_02090 [Breznakiella homolactica]
MNHGFFLFIRVALFFLFLPVFLRGEEKKAGFRGDLFFSGSWEQQGKLDNRGDLRLITPFYGLSARFQVLDRRPAMFLEDTGNSITGFSGGIYHKATNSRILYGTIDEWGLPARIRSPWIRSLPLAERHAPMGGDLKTETVSTREPAAYLYLGSPQFGPVRIFLSALADSPKLPDFGGGAEFTFKKQNRLRLEGFYTEQTLAARKSSTWFSAAPPLPERDFRLGAGSIAFSSPFFSFAADWAYSETYAYGSGTYGNLGITAGNKPWRVSLGADVSEGRYVGRDGKIPGEGLRFGGAAEYRGVRGSLYKITTAVRASAWDEKFNKSTTNFSVYFPRAVNPMPVWPQKCTVTLKRDGSSAAAEDSAVVSVHTQIGPLGTGLSASVKWKSPYDAHPQPYPVPSGQGSPYSVGGSGEATYKIGFITVKAKLGCTAERDKRNIWDLSLSAAAVRPSGRFRISLDIEEKLEDWNLGFSWQIRKTGISGSAP